MSTTASVDAVVSNVVIDTERDAVFKTFVSEEKKRTMNRYLNENVSGDEEDYEELVKADQGKRFNNVIFQRCITPALQCERTEFLNCIFKSCDFTSSRMTKCSFDNCRFENCRFFNTTMSNCKFRSIDFIDCELSHVDFSGSRFGNGESTVRMPVIFENCKMNHADFSTTFHEVTCFIGDCELRNAMFDHSSMQFCVFDKCDLKKASFLCVQMLSPHFNDTIMDDVNMTRSVVTESFTKPMDTTGWKFYGVEAANAEFHMPLIDGVEIKDSMMDGTQVPDDFIVQNCTISDSSFYESKMLHGKVIGTKFMGSIYGNTQDLSNVADLLSIEKEI